MLFQKYGGILLFHIAVRVSWFENFHENGMAQAALSLGHLHPSNLYHLISFCWCTLRMPTALPKLAGWIRAAATTAQSVTWRVLPCYRCVD
jgi:hypothetical protein